MKVGWLRDCEKFTHLKPVILHDSVKREKAFCPFCKKMINRVTDSHAKKHWRELGAKKRKDTTTEDLYNAAPALRALDFNDVYRETSVLDRLQMDYNLFVTSPEAAVKYQDEFIAFGFDQIILDESTMIKRPDSNRTKAIHRIGHSAKFRIIMTGTPVTNSIEDLWSQAYFMDQCLGPSFNSFIAEYFWTHPQHWYIRNIKKGAEDKILKIIEDRVISFRADDCLDLPPLTFVERDVTIPKQSVKKYDEILENCFTMIQDNEILPKTFLDETLKLQQISNGFVYNEDKEVIVLEKVPAKIREIKQILEETGDQKVVVWALFKPDFENLMKHLKDYNPVILKTSTIEESEKKFEHDPTCRVGISHPKSCKFGHTWNFSTMTIYYSMSYSAEDFKQTLRRNHRKGQDKPVTVYILQGGQIDELVWQSVKEDRDFGDNVMELLR